ncbi:carboxymuconolactone decarboxylase family protein [Streptomyces sp. NPDC002896]|uniref:carboxymuconolactone decarboxylase family protein n=1 Tax=Streptomyces sp. NPDC002896 TaxID=3154438 RepID=UPI003317CDD7
MNPRQKELAGRIAGRRGAVRGPFRVWLHSPEMCERAESLGAFARFDCSLPKHLRELTLLMAARNWDAQYSWNAHVHQAIEAGIPEAAVKAIAEKREAHFEDEADAAFYAFCREILEDHFVSDETFARAHAHFGSRGLVDTIGALGNFTMLGMCLNTFQVDLQPDREPPFPDIRGYARVAPGEGTAEEAADGDGARP